MSIGIALCIYSSYRESGRRWGCRSCSSSVGALVSGAGELLEVLEGGGGAGAACWGCRPRGFYIDIIRAIACKVLSSLPGADCVGFVGASSARREVMWKERLDTLKTSRVNGSLIAPIEGQIWR